MVPRRPVAASLRRRPLRSPCHVCQPSDPAWVASRSGRHLASRGVDRPPGKTLRRSPLSRSPRRSGFVAASAPGRAV